MTSYPTPLTPALDDLLASVPETSPVETHDVTFEGAGVSFGGFVAKPAGAQDARPAVLIISDWSGLNNHARVRAEMLARLGYVALAGDVYGGGVELGQEEASAAAGRYYGDTDLFRAHLAANLERLRAEPGVDPERIAVMGYCFGGSGALELARAGADIAGAVSFHGRLATETPAAEGAIQAPLLVLTGAADPVVPDDQVVDFENELRAAGAPDWQVVSYSGAMHAFTMPDTNAPDFGAMYDATANARSWVAMQAFFDEIFA
ncbi:dienelactone hydrolase [Subtercola sp. Z020]|uniref:dienelactone hydrolase family protein n=1 Tax=Subtercola sp. Z020 TaxID=2080582 RepID=UPI000CE82893|nr:dienelactone hydrolase family protein [Subtercola sp. Z020]PPF79449.1 dienelactone hydrolase [Subtercola sp. Z020]